MFAKVMAVLLLVPLASGAAYIKYDGIDGEARDSSHGEEIDILSWSFKAERGGHHSFEMIKPIDASSSDLFRSLHEREPLEGLTAIAKHDGKTLLIIHMKDVFVTSYEVRSEDRPTEHISLNFEEIKVTYLPETDHSTTLTYTGLE